MATHFSLQLWQAHPLLKMRWRSILFESGNLQSMYVHFHLYLSFIKCHFNLHLGPDKKSKIDTKIEKTSHIWYKLSYLLFGSEFLKNSGGSSSYMSHGKYFHKTRGDQNFCHEWSRWLRNSSIILIGILEELWGHLLLFHMKGTFIRWQVTEFLPRKKQMTAGFFHTSDRNSGRNFFWRILGSSAFMSHEKNFHNKRGDQNSATKEADDCGILQ